MNNIKTDGPLTPNDIERATFREAYLAARLVRRVEALLDDPHRTSRLKNSECRSCFYLESGGITTQGFRDYQCQHCRETKQHPNGNVPALCLPCAESLKACRRCGAAVDYEIPGRK